MFNVLSTRVTLRVVGYTLPFPIQLRISTVNTLRNSQLKVPDEIYIRQLHARLFNCDYNNTSTGRKTGFPSIFASRLVDITAKSAARVITSCNIGLCESRYARVYTKYSIFSIVPNAI